MPDGRPLVLVAGACLGGWAWQAVARELRGGGREVYPVTLTGLGERAHLASRDVDLETHIADVAAVLDYELLQDVVLVGHSYAGAVITGVAGRCPQRVGTVVYLDTQPLAGGTALAEQMPAEMRARQRREAVADGDGWLWPVPDRATLETGVFGSASGLDDAHFQMLAERATPQPYATFTSPLPAGDLDEHLRRVAILCSGGGMSLEMLEGLRASGDPRVAAFSDPGWELHELATGHFAMFSDPVALAALLEQIAAGPGSGLEAPARSAER